MFLSIFRKVFGSWNDWLLKKLCKNVDVINVLEVEYEKFFDEVLKVKIEEFKGCIEKGEIFDDILNEVFVMVREVSKCVYGMCYFDV